VVDGEGGRVSELGGAFPVMPLAYSVTVLLALLARYTRPVGSIATALGALSAVIVPASTVSGEAFPFAARANALTTLLPPLVTNTSGSTVGATVTVKLRVAVCAAGVAESATFTVNVLVPAWLGVPVIPTLDLDEQGSIDPTTPFKNPPKNGCRKSS
jgi:hypothetical protein